MIRVKGYSGCGIAVFQDESGEYVLEKSTSDAAYVPRLLKQAEKQIAFSRANEVKAVVAPRVLYRRTTSVESLNGDESPAETRAASAAIGMRFEHHTDALTFLHRADVHSVRCFGDVIVALLEQCVTRSPITAVPRGVFEEKLADVERHIARNPCISSGVRRRLISEVFPIVLGALPDALHLPVGVCHGDLTLSNILVRGNAAPTPQTPDEELRRRAIANCRGEWVVLIDFLDIFIETPLADLAKLHQDLRYGWTLRLHSEMHADTVKLFAVMAHLANMIFSRFAGTPWFDEYLFPFFIINQARVLQYCNSSEAAEYLLATIDDALGEWTTQRPASLLLPPSATIPASSASTDSHSAWDNVKL